MNFLDDAKAAATMPIPGPGTPDQVKRAFDAMPVAELASIWSALQRVGIRDHTDGTWSATLYFDALPHDDPDRAFDLVLAVLAAETDKSVTMQLKSRLMTALLVAHGPLAVKRIEAEAPGNARLRWLVGGVYWWGPDEAQNARLKRVADIAAWQADQEAHDTPQHTIDFEALPLAEMARAWVEQHCRPDKDRDANWDGLTSYELELKHDDPDKAIDLVLEILKFETNPMVLSFLAAGLLEDAIDIATIERIEREAAANERFRDLLGGVWYTSKPDQVKERLDAIVQRRRW
jgi:hypothetical protein